MAKKYIDADLLKKEINKHYDDYKTKFHQYGERYYLGLIDGIDMIKRIIDSLQQEQSCDTCTNDKGCVACKDGEMWEGKEQPSEDLEKAAVEFANQDCVTFISSKNGFIAGAKWQKEQMPSDEEMKCALRMEYEKGVFDTKQQMLKDAVEASVNYYENIPGGSYVELVADILNPTGVRYKDKVKIVIVKEEQK